jgi:hypothetical protein
MALHGFNVHAISIFRKATLKAILSLHEHAKTRGMRCTSLDEVILDSNHSCGWIITL